MKFRLSFTTSLIALLVTLVIASQAGSYRVTQNVLEDTVRVQELEKIRTMGAVIEQELMRDIEHVTRSAKLLARDEKLIGGLALAAAGEPQIIASRLDQAKADSRLELLEITDSRERVVYRAHDPARHGDRSTLWGVTEALTGNSSVASAQEPRGVSVRVIEPLRDGRSIKGALIGGTVIGDAFIARLSTQMNAHVTLLSREKKLSASGGAAALSSDDLAVRDAFQQKIPVYRHDPVSRVTRAFLPVLIVDDGYVMVAEIDSMPAYARLQKSTRYSLALTAIILITSILLGLGLLRFILKPLLELRNRTQRLVEAPQAMADTSSKSGDALSGIVHSLDGLTTRLVAQNQELKEAKIAADAASMAKSQFLSHMSHEIRTPLNGVLGMADLMQQTPLNPKQREYLQAIIGSGRTLNGLLSDVLDLAKIEAGKIEIEHTDFTLGRLITDVGDAYRLLAAEKGLKLSVKVDPALPRRISGDPTRLRQVLSNLVGNALKFTSKGSIALEVDRTYEGSGKDGGETHNGMCFSIRDTGIGMSPQTMSKLFSPFEQGESATTRKFGGTGLGLVICKHLIELMGGSVHMDSTEGQGTTISFTLPLTVASATVYENAPTAAPPAADSTFSINVLVAEDEPVNRQVIRGMLMHLGASVTIVEDGQQAVDAIHQHHFDIVFMDCQMPVLDGFSAAMQLRATESPERRLPIIALTANALAGDRQRCLEAGMDDYLTKPVNIARLSQILEYWTKVASEPEPALAAAAA